MGEEWAVREPSLREMEGGGGLVGGVGEAEVYGEVVADQPGADYVVAVHGEVVFPVAGVVAVGTIVAHDEVFVGAKGCEFQGLPLEPGGEVGFVESFAVDVGDAANDGDLFAGESDDSLDEGPIGVQGEVEDDDVAAPGAVLLEGVHFAHVGGVPEGDEGGEPGHVHLELVELVDGNVLAGFDGGGHAGAFHLEVLDAELEEQKDDEGQDEGLVEFFELSEQYHRSGMFSGRSLAGRKDGGFQYQLSLGRGVWFKGELRWTDFARASRTGLKPAPTLQPVMPEAVALWGVMGLRKLRMEFITALE